MNFPLTHCVWPWEQNISSFALTMELRDPSRFAIMDFSKVGHCKGSLNLRKHLLIKTELKLGHSCFLSSQ